MVGLTVGATVSVVATMWYPVLKLTQCAVQWILRLVAVTGLIIEFL
jgi:hypothetical protein